jgi:DNA-binding NtrC family response regulator
MGTILLVDNGPERSSIVLALARSGYTVIAADDGRALSLIREDAPLDLVIITDGITGFDGISFLTALRRRTPALPAIMLSSHGSIEQYVKALSLGVFACMNRPVAANELVKVVRSALEKAQTFEYADDF